MPGFNCLTRISTISNDWHITDNFWHRRKFCQAEVTCITQIWNTTPTIKFFFPCQEYSRIYTTSLISLRSTEARPEHRVGRRGDSARRVPHDARLPPLARCPHRQVCQYSYVLKMPARQNAKIPDISSTFRGTREISARAKDADLIAENLVLIKIKSSLTGNQRFVLVVTQPNNYYNTTSCPRGRCTGADGHPPYTSCVVLVSMLTW